MPLTDALAPFRQATLAIRWATTALAVGLADLASGDRTRFLVAALLIAYTAFRTVRPLEDDQDQRGLLLIGTEAAAIAVAMSATGHWESPFVFALMAVAAVAGFARGYRFGVAVALGAIAVVSANWAMSDTSHELRTAAEWSGEIVLVAVVAGYARRISGEAELHRDAALDRLSRLSSANVLLLELHQVAQALPASLDLTEALDTTMDQLRELFDAKSVAILLHEEADDAWHVARRAGGVPTASLGSEDLPPPLARSMAVRSPVHEPLLSGGGPGLDPKSGAGLYAVLITRGAVVGAVALEHPERHHFDERDLELLAGFVDPAALAIDNARWFGRLKRVGADEERARIARDLHDRTGQSLAYLAFELDRVTKQAARGDDVAGALDTLRGEVRKVVGELRDTLYDLRTEVTRHDGLASTLRAFLGRVGERSCIATSLDAEETDRLPLPRERELWRIAREAITGAERHAQADSIVVTWRCDGAAAELVVEDDGVGLASAQGGSLASAGLATLRERATGIGATLAVESGQLGGTRVRCTLNGA